MNGEIENRRSFRISESAFVKFEVIGERDFSDGLERWKIRLGTNEGVRSALLDIDARLNEKMFVLSTEYRSVADCLTLLNDKIETVLGQLPELRDTKASLAKQVPQDCELSADGMVFSVDQQYSPGTKMALRFLLASDNRYFETFCQVIRNVEVENNSNNELPHAVAVEFNGMKSAQKEMLIQHLFSRESESLRIRRLNMDAMG